MHWPNEFVRLAIVVGGGHLGVPESEGNHFSCTHVNDAVDTLQGAGDFEE